MCNIESVPLELNLILEPFLFQFSHPLISSMGNQDKINIPIRICYLSEIEFKLLNELNLSNLLSQTIAKLVSQLVEHRAVMREVLSSQLYLHKVRLSSLLGRGL